MLQLNKVACRAKFFIPTKYQRRSIQTIGQPLLTRALRKLFKTEELIINARISSGIRAINPLEFDAFLPNLNLAFEFQDDYHYFTTWYSELTEEVQKKDERKRYLAEEKGITLIEVPFWWDGLENSLAATIRKQRPDLLPDSEISKPIPLNPPEEIIKKWNSKNVIPGFGELTQASFLSDNIDTTNWLLFEKYDGIRAMWVGDEKKFYSRYGNQLPIPQDIIDTMPTDITLDGELWFGYGKIKEALKISARASPDKIKWEDLKYMVYDLPKELGDRYIDRYNKLKEYIESKYTNNDKEHKIIKLSIPIICKNKEHVIEYTNDIINKGGEGIIVRNPLSFYKHGRSIDYLKYKVYRDDEAIIIDHLSPDTYQCKLPNGITFISKVDKEFLNKEREPVKGDIVSFKYIKYDKKTGYPIKPIIYRYRSDISLDTLLSRKIQSRKLIEISSSKLSSKNKNINKYTYQRGYWYHKLNRREFLDNLAISHGLNPLNEDTWYKLKSKDIINYGGGRLIQGIFGGSYSQTIMDSYPELKFERDKLIKGKDWTDLNNQKKFLDNLAEREGFDPNVPDNWYKLQKVTFLKMEGGKSFLACIKRSYGNNIKNILSSVYPNLSFDSSRFDHFTNDNNNNNNDNDKLLELMKKIRSSFYRFASRNNFNPNDVNNWYMISREFIYSKEYEPIKSKVREMYNNNNNNNNNDMDDRSIWISELIKSFPNLEFDLSKFDTGKYWEDSQNLRKLFDKLAKDNGIDKMNVNDWNKLKISQVISTKEGQSMIYYYKGDINKAIKISYPELITDNGYHSDKLNNNDKLSIREFLNQLAKDRGFDPINEPSKWINIDIRDIRNRYYGNKLLQLYNNDIRKALENEYPEVNFKNMNRNINWDDIDNCRYFLNKFSEINGFDPKILDNWNHIKNDSIRYFKYGNYSGSSFIKHFKSLKYALNYIYS